MSLASDQRALYGLITGFGSGDSQTAKRLVAGGRGLSPVRRVRIYGDQYFWRMYEALAQDFPKVTSQLSERVLGEVVKRYSTDCPSRHSDLGRFGARFPTWLSRNKVEGARGDFADLAELEWAHTECFLEAAATPIDAAAMARVPAKQLPQARLTFVPACRLLTLRHSVAAAFEALGGNRPLPPLDGSKQALVVWRKELTVFHAVIGPEEARALNAAMAGKPLSRVVAHFGRASDPAQAAFAAVGSWVTEQMVAAVQA